MAGRLASETVLAEAAKIISTWKENTDFTLGTTTLADFEAQSAQLVAMDKAIDELRVHMTGLVEKRDKVSVILHDDCVRGRAGFKAVYGNDSHQYKQAGGTPKSERKPRRRKVKLEIAA